MKVPGSILALVLMAFGTSGHAAQGAAEARTTDSHGLPADFSALIEARLPSIVTVEPSSGTGGGQGSVLSGTGFLVGSEGHVVVPAGLVGKSDKVQLSFGDRSSLEGSLATIDEESGIAVVQISGEQNLPSLGWGSSQDLALGNWLVAVGRPQEGRPTAGVGIVEAVSDDFISSGMEIQPADIGSPVLNAKGEVVGVTALVRGPSGAPGSAIIPAERVRAAVEGLARSGAQTGEREPARLGIAVQRLDSGLASAFGIEPGAGVVVTSVEPGSAASEAGVLPGDIVTGFAGEKVEGPDQLRRLVGRAAPGQTRELEVLRNAETKTLSVALDAGTREQAGAERPDSARQAAPQQEPGKLGMRLLPLDSDLAKELGLSEINDGVVVVAVKNDAPADNAGIRPGDVIVAVGQRLVKGVNDVVSGLEQVRESGKDRVALLVYRDGTYQYVSVTV